MPRTPAPVLREREAGLDAIDDVLSAAAGGVGGALFLAGEAGVGKTALLEAAARMGEGRFHLGRGSADPLDASVPFGIVRQAIAGIGGVPDIGVATSGPDIRASLFYAVVRRLEEAAAAGPVLILLDDLQWADGDSLALVGLLCRRLPALSAAVVATMRPWPPAAEELARRLVGDRLAAIERLEPLQPESALELLRERAAGADDDALERARDLAAGNPLLLEQAAAMLADGGLPDPGAEAPRDLLVSRFAGVGDDALRLARHASLFGLAFRPRIAAELAGLDEAATDAAVEALGRAGLVRQQEPGRASFVHPLFAQALYESVEPPLRARLHARAFHLLRALGVDTGEAAEQALRGDLAGDAAAVEMLERAGRRSLGGGAVATAVTLLGGALRLAGDGAPPGLRRALAEARLLGGDPLGAIELCDGLLGDELLAPTERVETRRLRGRARFYLGDLGGSDADYAAAVAASRGHDADTAVEVAVEHATVTLFAAGPGPARPLAVEGQSLAAGASPLVRSAADLAGGITAVLSGDPAGIDAAEPAARLLIRDGGSERAASLAFFATAAACLERFDDADRAFSTAAEWGERTGDPAVVSLTRSIWAGVLLRSGRPGDAAGHAQRALTLGDLAPGARAFGAAMLAAVLQERGDAERAASLGAEAADLGETRGEWLPGVWLALVRLRRALDAPRPGDAAREAMWLMERTERLGLEEPCLVPWAGEALVALAGAGEDERLRALTARLERAAAALPCRWPRALVLTGRALAAERRNEVAAAEAAYTEAAGVLTAAPLAVERARLLLLHGALLRRSGRPVQARPLLGEALAAAEAAGAARLAQHAASELQVAGGRRRRRSGGPELTAAEERVARLAVEGLSNAEIAAQLFVSAKTVDTHLQHIYSKLGINSRRELMRRGLGAAAG